MKKVLLGVSFAALTVASSAFAAGGSNITNASAVSSSAVTSSSSATNVGIGYSAQSTGAFAQNRSAARTYKNNNTVVIGTRSNGSNFTYANSVSTGGALGSGTALSVERGNASGAGTVRSGDHDVSGTFGDHTTGIVSGYGEVDSESGVISGSYSASGNNGSADQFVTVGAANKSRLTVRTRLNVHHRYGTAKTRLGGKIVTSSEGWSYIAGEGNQSGDGFGVAGGLSGQQGKATGDVVGKTTRRSNVYDQASRIEGTATAEASSFNVGVGVNNFSGEAWQEAAAGQTTKVGAFTKANGGVKIARTRASTEGGTYVNGDELGAGSVWGFGTSEADAFGSADADARARLR